MLFKTGNVRNVYLYTVYYRFICQFCSQLLFHHEKLVNTTASDTNLELQTVN